MKKIKNGFYSIRTFICLSFFFIWINCSGQQDVKIVHVEWERKSVSGSVEVVNGTIKSITMSKIRWHPSKQPHFYRER